VDGWQWHSRGFVPLDRLTVPATARETARPLTRPTRPSAAPSTLVSGTLHVGPFGIRSA
jgi:hypothetical protein